MKKIVGEIAACKERYEKMPVNRNARKVSREEFTLLLSGISTCRRVPGIPAHMGYEKLYHCGDENDSRQVRQHLERMFGVKDRDSLAEVCRRMDSGSDEYAQFMTFWKNAPMFDIKELNANGQRGFERCKGLAENFYPLVKEKGFYAWDISEKIGLCRSAVACGILSDEEFWQITDEWVRQAQVFYGSYGEYAVSCLCGAMYDLGRYGEDLNGFLDINKNITESLLAEGGAWQRNSWYVPEKTEWAKLLKGNPGCFITKAAIDAGYIGYMYRDEPAPDCPDSGWRFFVGDEPEDYVNNPDNTVVCGLNTICNLSPDIMAFLFAGAGRRFGRQEEGWVEE